jgi:hypothetical protein
MTPIRYLKSKSSICHMTSAEIWEEATNEQQKGEKTVLSCLLYRCETLNSRTEADALLGAELMGSHGRQIKR